MIMTTMHSDILQSFIDVLRALSHQQDNAQVLIRENQFGLIVELLRLGHVGARFEPYDVWLVRQLNQISGPMDVEGLKQLDINVQFDVKSFDALTRYSHANTDWTNGTLLQEG